MLEYKKTSAYAYRKLMETSIIDSEMIDGVEDTGQYDGMDMTAITKEFLEGVVDDIIEILREFAKEDRGMFEENKEDFFEKLETALREPTLRQLTAKILIRREEDTPNVT